MDEGFAEDVEAKEEQDRVADDDDWQASMTKESIVNKPLRIKADEKKPLRTT